MMASKVKIVPGEPDESSHDFALQSKHHRAGFNFADEAASSMIQDPNTPSSLAISGSGGQWGLFDPMFTDFILADWNVGMGLDEYDISRSGFAHAMNMWTMQGDKFYPAPMHQHCEGVREAYEYDADDKDWLPLTGDNRFISSKFTVGGANFGADNATIWIRVIGFPVDLTVSIFTNTDGSPNAVHALATATIAASDFDDVLCVNQLFDLSAAADLTQATDYHIVIDGGASMESEVRCWEVLVDKDGTDSKYSAAGSSWTTASFSLIFRITGADIDRKWIIFWWAWLDYFVDVRADGSNSVLYENGWRGKATAADATTLTNANGGYTVDELIGWYIYFYSGKGAGQQPREILDNTATVITVEGWEETPDATSIYVIFGGNKLNQIETLTKMTTVKDVCVVDDMVFFAQGPGTKMSWMRWGGAPPAYEDKEAGNYYADFVEAHQHPTDGPSIWRGENDIATDGTVVSVTNSPGTWAGSITFNADIKVGDRTFFITDLVIHNDEMYVMKQNHPYRINKIDGKVYPAMKKCGFITHPENGLGSMPFGVFLMVPWGGNFLIKSYGASQDDVSPAQRGDGVPSNELGGMTSMLSHPGGIISVVDGRRDNYSSIYVLHHRNDGWHSIFRGYRPGQRIQTVYWQNNMAEKPKVWFSIGGDLMFMEFPHGFRPLKESMKYHHESVIETGTITLQARALPKLFEAIVLSTQNLNTSTKIRVQYKVDNQIGDNAVAWRDVDVGEAERSPMVKLELGEGGTMGIRFRLILSTAVASVPAVVDALSIQGLARKPVRYLVTFRVATESDEVDRLGGDDISPWSRKEFLMNNAASVEPLYLLSPYPDQDGAKVILEFPSIRRIYVDTEGTFGMEMSFTAWILKDVAYHE